MKWQILLCIGTFTLAWLFQPRLSHASDKKVSPQKISEASPQDNFSGIEVDMMCGPKCLWQIRHAFGKTYSLGAIAYMAGTTLQKGTTVKGMVEAAHKMGLQAKAVKTDVRALIRDPRVAILLLNLKEGNHYVIVDQIEDKKVRLLDADKFRSLSIDELKSIWNGYAILIGQPGDRGTNSLQKYFGSGLQITGLLILLAVATYGVKSTYLYLSKRQ